MALALIVVAPAATPVKLKLALVWPSGTVIEDGTVAVAVLALTSVTTNPPVGAGSDRVSGTERDKPGATNTPVGRFKDTGRTVTVVLPGAYSLAVAVIEADPMATVVKVKVAELDPAGIVNVAGTVAMLALLLAKVMFSPDDPAGTLDWRVTGAVRPTPKVCWLGVSVKEIIWLLATLRRQMDGAAFQTGESS